MNEQELKELLNRYNNNTAFDQEKALIESWYLQDHENNPTGYTLEERLEDAEKVWAGLHHEKTKSKIMPLLSRVTAAASILALLYASGYYMLYHKQSVKQIAKVQPHDIAPGSNKAILTLANGNKISITDAKNGIIIRQSGIQIAKNTKGQIVYYATHANPANKTLNTNDELAYNTITTPSGGQTAVTLSDGTIAFLDAGSSIKFPVIFTGSERRVAITGQVFFEVVHNAAKPFRVSVKGQTIEDVGTSFNINAYDDEPVIKTTLLSGSVRITKGGEIATLEPGQQAITLFNDNSIKVKNVDTEEAMAWKNGYFLFDNENLESVMRKISRWYDVDVTYPEGQKISVEYWGSITRYGNVSKVLNMLEETGDVKFRIDGKRIIVLKK